MPQLKNFVAVDWRAAKDKIYFFFKDTETYSRFDIDDNRVIDGHPITVSARTWDDFHVHVEDLRFGFTTTGFKNAEHLAFDSDILWFFYYDGEQPMVCKYDQDADKVNSFMTLAKSPWFLLEPYFDRIVAGTWRESALQPRAFEFLLNDGTALLLNLTNNVNQLRHINIKDLFSKLDPYKDRIITAVQNDRSLADSHYYVFLTGNQYLRFNLWTRELLAGPIDVNDGNWPGLLRD
jgi:hypothetical protein